MANEEKQQIEKLLNLYKISINTSNLELIKKFYVSNEHLSPKISSRIGVDGALVPYEYLVSQNHYLIDFLIEEMNIEENMAYVITTSKGTFPFLDSEIGASKITRIIFLLSKTDGEWKIIRHLSNAYARN